MLKIWFWKILQLLKNLQLHSYLKNLQLLKKSTVTPEKHPKDILIHG